MTIVICIAAFLASGLTFFSGFGLAMLLTPVFALWFPLDLAVVLTAVVHFFNNLFKIYLVGKHIQISVMLRFGIPAFFASMVGASFFLHLSDFSPLLTYEIWGHSFQLVPLNLVIAILMIAFIILELIPRYQDFQVDSKYLPLGGILSGFFGGISGYQGALRTVFLIRSGLTKEQFIGTGVAIAFFIDIGRLALYARPEQHLFEGFSENSNLIISATLAAISGAFVGNKFLKKMTLKSVQVVVSVMLFLFAIGLGSGILSK